MINPFKSKGNVIVRSTFRCSVSWDSMVGDEFVKKCTECKSSVYNLINLSDEEVIKFVSLHDGNVCAKLQMTRDGKIINGKCIKGAQVLLGRVAISPKPGDSKKEKEKDELEKTLRKVNVAKDRLNKLNKLYEMQKNKLDKLE